ncbi:hypothetical protein NLI96_g1760 [Meripilus lineatus]|uniref:DUF7918 domain-containing protein n=1 Tax=Meripilus lineatus TaxID=2056292 RepID=A0AAD5VEA7_9APHY|nr:hypothetical protein NLI96_g1760 [Physisporinus lineatus]
MPKFKGFEAYITDEKWNPLEEFMIEEFEDEKLVTCYVPSVSNQRFCIIARCHTRLKDSLCWTSIIHVDGTEIAYYLCGPSPDDTCDLSTVNASENTGRPLTFSNLKLTDNDEEVDGTADDLESLGTITVYFARFCASGESESTTSAIAANLKDQVLHERNKKAGCHRVSLGDPIPVVAKPRAALIGDLLDSTDSPQFRIMFRYRPIDLLQAQDIAPRPEPIPGKDANPDEPSEGGEGSSGGKRNADGDLPHSKSRPEKKRRVKMEDGEVANMRVRDLHPALAGGPSDIFVSRKRWSGSSAKLSAQPLILGRLPRAELVALDYFKLALEAPPHKYQVPGLHWQT